MNAPLKALAGLVAVALVGVAALVADGAPGSAASAQKKLERSVADALGPDDAAWAAVVMDGQKAVVTGEAPSEEARAALIARVAAASGRGGLLAGGVTAVDASGLAAAPPEPVADPYLFVAERENGTLALSGYVPDQETRDAIYRLAGELFPDTDISGALEIAGGAPADVDTWRIAAETSLRALYYLERGAVSAENARFAVAGDAQDDVRASAARMLMTALPGNLEGEADVAVLASEPPSQPAAAAAAPAQSEPEAEAQPADCAAPLRDAVAQISITYSSSDSDLDPGTQAKLRDVAALLAGCAEARLRITGHTDSRGRAAGNFLLSRERAEIVREFLIASGAPQDRTAAEGAGESQPIANNATEAGRERNRRIEFEIVSSP